MYQFTITANEAGQRFDKYLGKLLPKAPSSFFYKMLRKKNIVLNGKKAEGREKLVPGDKVSLFLSHETFTGFQADRKENEYLHAYKKLKDIEVIYENEHMLLAGKPAGILAQKAKDSDVSVNEWLIGYLLEQGEITENSLSTFKPSICNRLDRNTSGLIICAKSLAGSQRLNELIKKRRIRKFYRLFVKGSVLKEENLEGYLIKDERNNKVMISSFESEKGSYIKTRYYPLEKFSDMTYLEVELITGKTHQIRAHMASAGHPLLGDYKYGNRSFNDKYKEKYGISSQLLHACRLEFPEDELLFGGKSYIFTSEEPAVFREILKDKEKQLWQPGIQGGFAAQRLKI